MTTPRASDAGSGISGIVLAGGRSRRFGSDKLEAEIDGRTLLDRAVAAVGIVAGEVLVVLGPGDERPLPASARSVRRVIDREAAGGPLIGLLAGLEAAAEPVCLIAGGDMPSLQPDVLARPVRVVPAPN